MAGKVPTAGRFFYFHIDNSEEVKQIWNELAKRFEIKLGEKDESELIKKSFKTHGLTNIKIVEGEKAILSIKLYKNIVVVSGLFFLQKSVEKIFDELSHMEIPGTSVAIGGAIILIKKGAKGNLVKKIGPRFTKIDTKIGELCQFEEKEGLKEHVYALTQIYSSEDLEHFLTVDFPLFDFSIHKLHVERDYFKNQVKWIVNERTAIDKSIGDILHNRIVGETLNPKLIEDLEKDIDTLSSKYAILVNDSHLIRKARTTLEDDIEVIYDRLKEFGEVPSEGLEIVKDSIDLKKKLEYTENSLSYGIKSTKTAIDTVRTNIDLLRSRENIYLQEESVSFQVAAGVLEFIIIYYYSIASWEHIIGVERLDVIPPPIRFMSILLFASLAVALTHFVGTSYKENWKLNKGMIFSALGLLAVFLYIVLLSIQTGSLHPS
jgi:hypothetical protein